MSTYESRTVTVRIERPYEDVYGFVKEPTNNGQWATGMGTLEHNEGEFWTAKGPDGSAIRVRLTAPNEFGILDHWVTFEDGTEIYLPVRVIRSNTGTEVQFTVFRRDRGEEEFAMDAAWVQKDLNALKELMER